MPPKRSNSKRSVTSVTAANKAVNGTSTVIKAKATKVKDAENTAPVTTGRGKRTVTKSTSKASLKKVDNKSFASTGTVVSNGTTTTATNSRKRKASSTTTSGSGSLKRTRTLVEPVNALPQSLPADPSGERRCLLDVGCGDSGQFGMRTDHLKEYNKPRFDEVSWKKIEEGEWGPNGVERVAAGGMHSLVLDSNGKIWSSGVNDYNALGRKTQGIPDKDNTELEAEFGLVEALDDFRAAFIGASDSCSVAVSDKGELRAWGAFSSDGILGFDGKAGNGKKAAALPTALPAFEKKEVCQVACGEDHVVALTTSGTVYTWGNGVNFQLGRRIMERRIANGLRPEPLTVKDVVLVAAGHHHSFAVDKNGIVYAWGLNQMRQCGVSDAMGGKEGHIKMPTEVEALNPAKHNGAKVIQIGRGEHHTIFLLDNGEVYGCGRAEFGRLGLAEDHPAMIQIQEDFQQELKDREEAKQERIKKAKAKGKELTEEEIDAEQQERLVPDARVPEPVRISFPPPPNLKEEEADPPVPPYKDGFSSTKIVGITGGSRYTLAWDADGILYSWGEGVSSQLGLGEEDVALVPTRVHSKALQKWKVTDASAGGQHVLIIGSKRAEPLPS